MWKENIWDQINEPLQYTEAQNLRVLQVLSFIFGVCPSNTWELMAVQTN